MSGSLHGACRIALLCLALAPPAQAATETVLHAFAGTYTDGSVPIAGLINVGGVFYGTTEVGGPQFRGTVFKISSAGAETAIYGFGAGSDAQYPGANLIAADGQLFGTTLGGGSSNLGTVFKVTPAGRESVLYSFQGNPDGKAPQAPLLRVGSVFYSATLVGGTQNAGALFRVTQAGAENILHSFDIAEGGEPTGLVLLGKHFYGTNYAGGLGYGTVFSATANGQVTILHVFTNGGDGGMPNGALLNVGGVLYGTTATGGGTGCAGKGCGTIYSVTADGTLTTLYTFKGGSDGAAPAGSLIAVDGVLYGTTSSGGATGVGTVFKVSTSGEEEVLHSFKGGTDGANPAAPLLYSGGALYGTTSGGGNATSCSDGCGTVFKIAF